MKKYLSLFVIAVALTACGKKEEPKAAASVAAANVPAECTEYTNKMTACVEKLSKSNKQVGDTMKQQMDAAKAQWSGIADKAALGQACKAALDAYSKSALAMGC
jgi:Prokaryotic membrane lipoprotein lipid attachment site